MMQSSVAHCNNMTAGGRPNEPKSIPKPRVYLVGGPVPSGALVPQAVMAYGGSVELFPGPSDRQRQKTTPSRPSEVSSNGNNTPQLFQRNRFELNAERKAWDVLL